VPYFELVVDDLARQPDDELKRRSLPIFPKLVLWALRDARTIQRFYETSGAGPLVVKRDLVTSKLAELAERVARIQAKCPPDAAGRH